MRKILYVIIVKNLTEFKILHIAVCIKQVPDTNNVKWSKENNLLREGLISILNPCDDWAIQTALSIKKKFKNVKISAVTMGPKQAKEVLEYALARGCDEAILLCDKAFSGSDTLSTGRILSQAIKKFIPECDLIICGQYAIDGDTAQSGPTIAGFLDIPVVTRVYELINADTKMSIAKQELDEGINLIEVENPCVICVLEHKEQIEPLRVADYVRAQNIKIKELSFDDLGLNRDEVGVLGSPTFVSKAFKKEYNRLPELVEDNICGFLSALLREGAKNGK